MIVGGLSGAQVLAALRWLVKRVHDTVAQVM